MMPTHVRMAFYSNQQSTMLLFVVLKQAFGKKSLTNDIAPV